MSLTDYDLLTKMGESAAADALRSAKLATTSTLFNLEVARRIVEHTQQANNLSLVAKNIVIPPAPTPPAVSQAPSASAAISANAAASTAHSATASLYQLLAQTDKTPSDVATIVEHLKNAESSRLDVQKARDAATTLRAGLASASPGLMVLLLAAAHANDAAADCSDMVEKLSMARAVAGQQDKPPDKPTNKTDNPKPPTDPTSDEIRKEAFTVYTQHGKQPAETVAADRDWFEAKANLLERENQAPGK
jgi:hypothetical protein